jgi:hypothetical protein
MRPLHQLAETNSRVGWVACTSASLRGADLIRIPMVKRNKERLINQNIEESENRIRGVAKNEGNVVY